MRQHAEQYNAKGELRHLLTLEDVPRAIIQSILDTAESFLGAAFARHVGFQCLF